MQLTDEDGEVTKTYVYDAFGVEKDPDSADPNPFRYCGEYFDRETGTYYLRARYYSPETGRFTQEDTHWNPANRLYGDEPQKINERTDKLGLKTYAYAPDITAVMQSGNLYAYCAGNPVMYRDVTGDAGELAQAWTAEMAWITMADGMLPFGDLIYLIGVGAASIADFINTIGVDQTARLISGTPNAIAEIAEQMGSSTSPGTPDPRNNKNTISQSLKRHILNRHDPHRAAQELKYLNPQQASEKFAGRSFFNANWTEEQIMGAVEYGYQQAIQAGVSDGAYVFSYGGEQITLYFEQGLLQTAYGSYYYSIAQLLALLG